MPHCDPFFARYPPPPPPVLTMESAHLYLNRSERIGSGNHSHIYRATWKIPRTLVSSPYVCRACAENAILVKLREEAPDVDIDKTSPTSTQLAKLMFAITARRGAQVKVHFEEVACPGISVQYEPGDGPVTAIRGHNRARSCVCRTRPRVRRPVLSPTSVSFFCSTVLLTVLNMYAI